MAVKGANISLTPAKGPGYMSQADDHGIARMKLIPHGRYAVDVDPGFLDPTVEYLGLPNSLTSRMLNVQAGMPATIWAHSPLDPEADSHAIEIVAEPSREPLEGIVVSGFGSHRGGLRASLGTAITNEAGLVKIFANGDLSQVQVQIADRRFEKVAQFIDIEPGGRTILRLVPRSVAPRLMESGPPGAVNGLVSDTAGTPLPGSTVILSRRREKWSDTTEADTSGRFAFKDVSPGEYEVRARYVGYSTDIVEVAVDDQPLVPVRLMMMPSTGQIVLHEYYRAGPRGVVFGAAGRPVAGAVVRLARGDTLIAGESVDITDGDGSFDLGRASLSYTNVVIDCGSTRVMIRLSDSNEPIRVRLP
jgi:hypothetical protein